MAAAFAHHGKLVRDVEQRVDVLHREHVRVDEHDLAPFREHVTEQPELDEGPELAVAVGVPLCRQYRQQVVDLKVSIPGGGGAAGRRGGGQEVKLRSGLC